MSVDAHCAGSYVRGDGEVGEPQVFYVSITECAHDRLVEVGPFEH